MAKGHCGAIVKATVVGLIPTRENRMFDFFYFFILVGV